jgi:hypothetical protein
MKLKMNYDDDDIDDADFSALWGTGLWKSSLLLSIRQL